MNPAMVLDCRILVHAEDILSIEPLWDNFTVLGVEYHCVALLREGLKAWPIRITVHARELAPVLFPEVPAPTEAPTL